MEAKAKRTRAQKSSATIASAARPAPVTIVKPVDNAIRILRYLNVIGTHSTVTMISRELKINPSTCFNILRTLVWNGVLEFDPVAKSYRTGPGAIDLANAALRRGGHSVAERMQPLLETAAKMYEVAFTVWRRVGEDRMMLVYVNDSYGPLRVPFHLGQRLPLLIGAGGRIMAAFGGVEESDIRKRFKQLRWNRPIKIDEYLRQVRRARKNGWSIDDGNYMSAVWSVAAPIFNEQGTLRGTVTATSLRGQHNKATEKQIITEVQRLANEITQGIPESKR